MDAVGESARSLEPTAVRSEEVAALKDLEMLSASKSTAAPARAISCWASALIPRVCTPSDAKLNAAVAEISVLADRLAERG